MDSESTRRGHSARKTHGMDHQKLDKTRPNTNMDRSQLLNELNVQKIFGKDANMQCDSSGGLTINVIPHYYSTEKLSFFCKLEIDHSDMSGF